MTWGLYAFEGFMMIIQGDAQEVLKTLESNSVLILSHHPECEELSSSECRNDQGGASRKGFILSHHPDCGLVGFQERGVCSDDCYWNPQARWWRERD